MVRLTSCPGRGLFVVGKCIMNYPRNKYRLVDSVIRQLLPLMRFAAVTGLYAVAILVGAVYLAHLVNELKANGF